MHKLLRYYNQNRKGIWVIILIIIFILLIIQAFNNVAKENKKTNEEEKETTDNVVSYRNESKAIITEKEVSKSYQNDFGEIIDEFFTYCVNHEPEKAYEMLSTDTKTVLYPSEKLFENLYYKDKFAGDKQYSFQAWDGSGNKYIYQVKIFDNMLSTGKKNDTYIEDYISISLENGDYTLNINSYLGRQEVKKQNSNDMMTIEVDYIDVYMDYQIYTFNIKNNTDKEILLDAQRKNKTAYIMDSNDNRFEAILYELSEEDLRLKPKEFKTIEIKYNIVNRSNMEVTSVNFTDCVEYDKYLEDKQIEGKNIEIRADSN